MLIGTSEVPFDSIARFDSVFEPISIKFPVLTTETVSPDEDSFIPDSDDDGVGLGEPRATTRSVIVGYATLVIKVNYANDFENVVTRILTEERAKQSSKINAGNAKVNKYA